MYRETFQVSLLTMDSKHLDEEEWPTLGSPFTADSTTQEEHTKYKQITRAEFGQMSCGYYWQLKTSHVF